MPRLLVVEDDENLREMIEEWLIMQKYTVTACGSGMEAWEHLSMLSFDAILLDWHLSDMTGLDILKKYRAAGGKAIIMMLTGSTTHSEREEALVAGADSYMCKPFKLPELTDNVKKLLAARS